MPWVPRRSSILSFPVRNDRDCLALPARRGNCCLSRAPNHFVGVQSDLARNAFRRTRLLRRDRRSRVQEDPPSLQGMVKRGHLNVPVIGAAKANWDLNQFRARTRQRWETPRARSCGVREAGRSAAILRRRLRGSGHVRRRPDKRGAQRPAHYLAIPRFCSATLWSNSGSQAAAKASASSWRSRSGRDFESTRKLNAILLRSFDEDHIFRITITSASGRRTTWSSSASRTRSWSRSGIASSSRACRSQWLRRYERATKRRGPRHR